MAFRSREGSTARLLQLCGGYYISYVLTGIVVKWYTGGLRTPRLTDMAFLLDNTLGSSVLCVLAVLAFGWLHLPGATTRRWAGMTVPVETPYIVVSGVCTAIIIPATTLLYTLPISVMVAMVIMRGSVIVISRCVDAVLARRGLLRRKVYAQENWAVVFALLALSTNVVLVPIARRFDHTVPALRGLAGTTLAGSFDFLHSGIAMWVLVTYILAYAVRLYWMNVFKLTRPPGPSLDNRGYFAIEQVVASGTMALAVIAIFAGTRVLGWQDARLVQLTNEIARPNASAVMSGVPYALVAFFSVFLFMFHGRSATFAGLVNRITSLLAGTTATLLLALVFHLPPPSLSDWVSLTFVLIAVALLGNVETRRPAERPVPLPAPALAQPAS
jgi:hypothetical protein